MPQKSGISAGVIRTEESGVRYDQVVAQLPGWMKISIAILLLLLPSIGGIAMWVRLKLRLGILPLILLGALVLGALFAGGYMMFDMWLVARNQGHF